MSIDMVFSNYFETRLNAELDVAATSIAVQSVANMPVITGSEYFYLTIFNTTTREIVKVTNVDIPSLTITIERGKDDTTAVTWPTGSKIAYFITKVMMEEVLAAVAEVPEVPDAVEELLHTETISSSVANVEIDLSTFTAYRRFRVEWDLEHATPSSNYCKLKMELKLNGTWKTTGYESTAQAKYSGQTSGAYDTTIILLSNNICYNSDNQSGHMILINETGIPKKGYGEFVGDSDGSGNLWNGGISYFCYDGADEDSKIDEIRISGDQNLTGGKIRVYGVQD